MRIAPIVSSMLLVLAVRQGTAQGIPDRIADSTFWQMMTTMSEPGGSFRSENMLSNETGYQGIIPELLKTVKPGNIYMGVGPEQNFTYIVALHPSIAFIVDIRHQNAMQHLIYKALMEMSPNRPDFLAHLFSRPRPADMRNDMPIDSMMNRFAAIAQDSVMYYRTLAEIKDRLTKTHGFPLSADELQWITHNLDTFYWYGPDISYNSNSNNGNGGFGGGRGMPNYTQLMAATDYAGERRSYLATEANYAMLRDFELRNLLVPLTGDFGGPKAIRAVGDWARAHQGTVGAFYASNVEQYLWQDGIWTNFLKSVATLPADSTSTMIRSGGGGGRGGGGFGGGMARSLLQPIPEMVRLFNDGKIVNYQDVLMTSH